MSWWFDQLSIRNQSEELPERNYFLLWLPSFSSSNADDARYRCFLASFIKQSLVLSKSLLNLVVLDLINRLFVILTPFGGRVDSKEHCRGTFCEIN